MKMAKVASPPFAALRASWDYSVPEGFQPEDRVYRMRVVFNDERFVPLEIRDRNEYLLDFFELARRQPKRLSSLRARWAAPRVEDRVAPWNDIPMIGAEFPAFSTRAVGCLRDLLEPDGILLPLNSTGRTFVAYVPRSHDNLLVAKDSEVDWERVGRQKVVLGIRRYAFDTRRLRNLSIFSLSRERHTVYVTDRFVQRVKQAGLLGANFEIVFPLRASDDWQTLAGRALKLHAREKLPRGKRLGGQMIYVHFLLDDPNAMTTARQDGQLLAWAKRLGNQLHDRDSMLPAVGSVVLTSPEQGRYTVVVSGPDATKLRSQVSKMIPTAQWPGEVRISRRAARS